MSVTERLDTIWQWSHLAWPSLEAPPEPRRERHRALRPKKKQFLIDYDNHHLNQIPSVLLSSPAALLLHSLTSPTLIYSTPPQGILLSWQNTGKSHLQNLPPLNHTYSHTHECTTYTHENAILSISQTHKTKLTDVATCIMCVRTVRAVSSWEALNSIPRCGVVHVYSFYQHIRARLHVTFFCTVFPFE